MHGSGAGDGRVAVVKLIHFFHLRNFSVSALIYKRAESGIPYSFPLEFRAEKLRKTDHLQTYISSLLRRSIAFFFSADFTNP